MAAHAALQIVCPDIADPRPSLMNCLPAAPFGHALNCALFSGRNSGLSDGATPLSIRYPRRTRLHLPWNVANAHRVCVCESGNGEDRWGGDGQGQVRKSRVPLALANFPITQPSVDAEETETFRLEDEVLELAELKRQFQACGNLKQRIAVLDSSRRVRGVFGGIDRVGFFVKPSVVLASRALDEQDLYYLKCLVAIGQEHLLDWPADAGTIEEQSTLKCISAGPAGYLKEAFTMLGNAIESREDAQGQRWPSLLATRREELSLGHPTRENGKPSVERAREGDNRLTNSLKTLIAVLVRLERFYDSIGGIIGYQLRALELIRESEVENVKGTFHSINGGTLASSAPEIKFSVPLGTDLSKDEAYETQAARWGLEGLPAMGEIYPLGGSGDRLGLVDESTGESLPVAMLQYCGRTLLEGLIRDLQAREYLYFKVFGKQHITPVAIMTSAAKQNNERVLALFESQGWFGRGKGNFRLFEQPLVPIVAAADGKWLVSEPLRAVLKPGGHGVIWKLANDEGIFTWFYSKERKAAIVRQISNPVAATDCTLLALSGIGLKHNKKLGFASCQRNVGTAEGVNVLIEKRLGDGSREYSLTCIEYTEFKKLGILDVPVTPGSMQAQYPANTNVLYVDLQAVEHVSSSQTDAALPGMIMNLKKPVDYINQWGAKCSIKAGRLECTMQNVADSFITKHSPQFESFDPVTLDTYVMYNQRRKVTSSAKRRRKPGEHSLHQTPDGSFLDLTRNYFDLLTSCGTVLPQMEGNHCYVDVGPPFVVFMHPSMGPLWDIILQKIEGGSLTFGSELQLEIAEFSWNNVQLDGSLLIQATNIMGSVEDSENKESILQYGVRCGRCKLKNVQVNNKGIDWRCASNIYWQNKIERLESLEIILEEDAEFEAKDVLIKGPHKFFVPKGHRMVVTSSRSGEMISSLESLPTSSPTAHGSWFWNYQLQESGKILLEMVNA